MQLEQSVDAIHPTEWYHKMIGLQYLPILAKSGSLFPCIVRGVEWFSLPSLKRGRTAPTTTVSETPRNINFNLVQHS